MFNKPITIIATPAAGGPAVSRFAISIGEGRRIAREVVESGFATSAAVTTAQGLVISICDENGLRLVRKGQA